MFLHFFSRRKIEERKTLFRNFIFGVEDSLVSTVGLLSGVAAADTTKQTIVTTGVVLIFVEAFSMGIGSFLSEETAGQFARHKGSRIEFGKAGGVMFISYLLAGLIPLSPYALFDRPVAVSASIGLTLISLILLGVVSAHKSRGNIWSKAAEMLILGGLATLVGMGIGSFFRLI